jgi:hypothetical protein
MTNTLIGYARCSTDKQDLTAQRRALIELGVPEDRIYTDHGLTGRNRVLLGQLRPMGGEPQLLGALLEGGDLGFGEAETAVSCASLRHAPFPTAMMRQKRSFIPR